MELHNYYMMKCLELAAKGKGYVAPNPMVGSVILHNNKIIGEGYHEYFGGPHAEVNAINSVQDKSLLKTSTIYVNLEPCSHFGKTPPCSDLIIAHKIPHVIIGAIDDNQAVAGEGVKKLQQANIKVEVNILKDQCIDLNKRFYTFHNKKRPYIILKWAESSDGFLNTTKPHSTKEDQWITNNKSKSLVHQQRATEQAILIGKNTALNDNPTLTTRLAKGKNPLRIVIGYLNQSENITLITDDEPLLVFNTVETKTIRNKKWILFNGDLSEVMTKLHELEIQSVIVEGGANILTQFINNGLWNEAHQYIGDKIFTEGLCAPKMHQRPIKKLTIDTNELYVYLNL